MSATSKLDQHGMMTLNDVSFMPGIYSMSKFNHKNNKKGGKWFKINNKSAKMMS